MAWPSGLERILEVVEEMLGREEEPLKLLVLTEYLSYQGRGSQNYCAIIEASADYGKGKGNGAAMSAAKGVPASREGPRK